MGKHKKGKKKKARNRKSRVASPTTEILAARAPESVVAEAVAVQVVAAIVEQVADAVIGDEPAVVDEPHEKRACPRVALAVEIDFASESHFFAGLSGDLSEGGVFVETYRTLPVGSEVALEFSLPNGTVTTHGEVRWHRDASDSSPPGLGIAFADLSHEEKSVVHDFCKARAPLYYEVDHAS
jgi:uncharacterized protein (TIGR02266 family)